LPHLLPIATSIRASPVIVGFGTVRSRQAEQARPAGMGLLGLICFPLQVNGPPTGKGVERASGVCYK
jgi:hypothetical protein